MLILNFLIMSVDYISLYMALNKPLELGLKVLPLGFFSLASLADFSLFIYHCSYTTSYLLLYVDDIIITRNDTSQISHFITALSHAFELKYLGALSYFLGIQIVLAKFGLTLCQSKYALIFSIGFTWRMLGLLKHLLVLPLDSLLILVPPYLIHLSTEVWLGHYNTWHLLALIWPLVSISCASSCSIPPPRIQRLPSVFFAMSVGLYIMVSISLQALSLYQHF